VLLERFFDSQRGYPYPRKNNNIQPLANNNHPMGRGGGGEKEGEGGGE